MKVPKGKVIYVGQRKYTEGKELPDSYVEAYDKAKKKAEQKAPAKVETK